MAGECYNVLEVGKRCAIVICTSEATMDTVKLLSLCSVTNITLGQYGYLICVVVFLVCIIKQLNEGK